MSHRLLVAALLLAGLGLTLLRPPASAKEPTREEQVSQLEKQIAELQARLVDLKKAPAPVPKSTEVLPSLPADWTKALSWRCIGPASMGGRIVALSVYEADPTMYWVATASGGLLKTTNAGVTFEHQFDKEATVSIGDVAVAQSDPKIVWVGTGEHNPRNSVSYGDGVYKSIDGGKTWKNMGLPKSFQIGRVVVHPKNPDIVYVGALGRLYGPSEERGLYKTTDGGKTWAKIHHVDNDTGVIEMQMHPTDPETILFATWERRRDGFDSHAGALAGQFNPFGKVDPPLADGYDGYDPSIKWGKGSGLWKTTDGGKTIKRLTKGLPNCAMGRIGIDFFRKDPKILYAVIDSAMTGMGTVSGYLGVMSADDPNGVKLTEITANSPALKAGLKANDIVTKIEGKPVKNGEEFGATLRAKKPGDKVSVEILRAGKPETVVVTLGERPGERRPFRPEITPLDRASTTLTVGAVTPGSALQKAGLQKDDVIVALNKTVPAGWRGLFQGIAAVEPGQAYTLTFQRGKDAKTISITTPPPVKTSRPYGAYYGGQRENVQDIQGPEGSQYGGVYRSADGGESWTRINSVNPRPMYFSQIRVDPADEKRLYVLGVRVHLSDDGGKSFRAGGDDQVHPDMHAMWIDPRDTRHALLGTDGGTYVTRDRCAKWDYLNTKAMGQFYHVAVDSRKPYRVYGGMQDNGSWGGPSLSLDGRGPINSDWVMVQGGDGFVCRVDPLDPDVVYAESQEGNMARTHLVTGERASIKPRSGQGEAPYRFNWNTPFILSSHNPRIVYSAGNHVFRSVTQGTSAKPISPEITKSSQASASALAESPRNAEVLWAGTDDGNLWLTRDGGAKWDNVAAKVGLPKPYWVATIEPSRAVEGRCYVCFDAHRSDDDAPYVYVTEDFGQTWKSLRGNLPNGSSRCLREDLYNPDVLYLGTEFAVFASIDRGQTWTKISNNLPTVAVHELAQHPTAGELVAATHGRSIWILDIAALRQMKPAATKADATLFAPNTTIRWRHELTRGTIYGSGHRDYFGENAPSGAQVYYALTKQAASMSLVVQDFAGKTVATLVVKNEPGLHRATWNLYGDATTGLGLGVFSPSRLVGAVRRGSTPSPAGQYRIVLKVDGKEQVQGLKLDNDPTLPTSTIIAEPPEARKKRSMGLED